MRLAAAVLMLAMLAVPVAGAPEQVHLGLPSDPSTGLSVLWVDALPEPDAGVTLRLPSGPKEVPAQLVPGPGAGFVYEARLTGLPPAAALDYSVGGRSFTLHTAPQGPARFRFVALGDTGITEQAHATVEHVQHLAPDFVVHAGDLAYAEGDPAVWQQWFAMVEPVAARVPWVTALGNHETYTGPEEGPVAPPRRVEHSPLEVAFYLQRFGLPGNEKWFSFDWGGAHIVALDTYTEDWGQGYPDAEVAWLRQDLDAHADAAWSIVFLHETPYSSEAYADGTFYGGDRVREAFFPVLEAHGVDLLIAGHVHNYERTFPMRGGEPTRTDPGPYREGDGLVVLTTGGGGRSLYDEWKEPAPAWSAKRAAVYEVALVDVSPERIEVTAVPTAGDAFEDHFVIAKDDAARSGPQVRSPDVTVALLAVVLALAAASRARRA
jgi:hypothetical protein